MRWFRYLLGGLCACAGIIFLFINSTILTRGAMRWALSDWDRMAYGTVAALVPWIVAITPFIIVGAWMVRRRGWALVGCFVYVVFVIYNVIGSGGAIALNRSDVIAERRHGVQTEKSRTDRREALVRQRDAIPANTRPSSQVQALIEAEHAKVWWKYSESCEEPNTRNERRFCAAYGLLQAEAGAALALEALNRQIAALDAQMDTQGPASEQIDPQAALIASVMRWANWSEAEITKWLPLATPAVLEIGAMFLVGLAIVLLELNHRAMLLGQGIDRAQAQDDALRTPAPVVAAGGSLPARAPPAASRTLTGQIQLAEWFFSECLRPVRDGAMTEEHWYALYQQVCRRSQDQPLPQEGFRRIARKYVPEITEVDGRVFYQRVLPLLPKEAA